VRLILLILFHFHLLCPQICSETTLRTSTIAGILIRTQHHIDGDCPLDCPPHAVPRKRMPMPTRALVRPRRGNTTNCTTMCSILNIRALGLCSNIDHRPTCTFECTSPCSNAERMSINMRQRFCKDFHPQADERKPATPRCVCHAPPPNSLTTHPLATMSNAICHVQRRPSSYRLNRRHRHQVPGNCSRWAKPG